MVIQRFCGSFEGRARLTQAVLPEMGASAAELLTPCNPRRVGKAAAGSTLSQEHPDYCFNLLRKDALLGLRSGWSCYTLRLVSQVGILLRYEACLDVAAT